MMIMAAMMAMAVTVVEAKEMEEDKRLADLMGMTMGMPGALCLHHEASRSHPGQ